MAISADCPSCQHGDHSDHDPRWGVRPGLIGGVVCGCTGDCSARAEKARRELSRKWRSAGTPQEPTE